MEEEVENAIAGDPDLQTPDDGNGVWLGEWQVRSNSGEIILPLSIDIKCS